MKCVGTDPSYPEQGHAQCSIRASVGPPWLAPLGAVLGGDQQCTNTLLGDDSVLPASHTSSSLFFPPLFFSCAFPLFISCLATASICCGYQGPFTLRRSYHPLTLRDDCKPAVSIHSVWTCCLTNSPAASSPVKFNEKD